MYRVRAVWTGMTGSPYLTTLYFTDTGGLTAQNAVNAVGVWLGALDASLPNILTWSTEPEVDHVNLSGAVTGTTATTTATGTGSISAVNHSPASQSLIRWFTGSFLGGRELRGRTFIPGVSNSISNSANGTPTTTWVNLMNSTSATLIADVNSELLVWSKSSEASAPVTAASGWTQFAVLRSRRD